MRILIAEDNDDLNRVVTAALKLNGYDVDSSFDGEEAMEYLKTTGYDAIILDLMMSTMDGMEVLKRLREMNIFTPVLILTAKSEVEDKISGLDAGADDYLTKP
ncbi:MAG: response regulator, partial [Eubacterium sp.]|nr:response regulator [Eubacterium sp.]